MFLISEFGEAREVVEAIQVLKARGFDTAEIDIFSTEPVELPPGLLDRPSRMSLIAVAGAATLCLLAIAFVAYTQYNFRLITGGMPIFSFWATGVVFYEFTMLGAIAATFLWFLWEAGLLQKNHTAPLPAPDSGRIYLRLECDKEQVGLAGECLYKAGAASVKRAEPRT